MKKKFGIIGNPVKHSLSPVLHKYWFGKYGLDASYSIIEAKDGDLKNIVKKIRNKELAGINVTLPFKQKIINQTDKIINDAIELLMQEAALNCRLIATLDGVKESELLKLTEEPVQKLLSSRTQEIDDKLCDLKLLRSGIKRVQDHLPKND